jgi:methanogenic corrinoid protein MtbC1
MGLGLGSVDELVEDRLVLGGVEGEAGSDRFVLGHVVGPPGTLEGEHGDLQLRQRHSPSLPPAAPSDKDPPSPGGIRPPTAGRRLTSVDLADARDRYLEAALVGDRPSAALLTAELLADGHEPRSLVTELLAPAQREIGQWWLERRCTVGQEHIVTTITDAILTTLTVGYEPPATRGHVVMTCAEGEWHALGARMAAELLMLDGWRVTILTGSLPAAHLRRYLSELEADAVGISCTIAANLPGAARSIAAARDTGHTVIAGGLGFGTSPARAAALGADGWAGDLADGLDLDRAMFATVRTPPADGPWLRLDEHRDAVVDAALAWLGRRQPSLVPPSPEGVGHVRSDLQTAVAHTAAALVCDDPTVLTDYAAWLHELLRADGLPLGVARLGFEALARVSADLVPEASALLHHLAGG